MRLRLIALHFSKDIPDDIQFSLLKFVDKEYEILFLHLLSKLHGININYDEECQYFDSVGVMKYISNYDNRVDIVDDAGIKYMFQIVGEQE